LANKEPENISATNNAEILENLELPIMKYSLSVK
jgi:hypothetical protein